MEHCTKIQYPLDSNSYNILDEIGVGVSAVVYKAQCLPMNSALVAIKAIDLDKSRSDFDSIRTESKTMSLLSHPNILNALCSFTVDCRLWVVMPFMSGGSLQSIISSAFPNGLSEQCIAIVLKETLNALSYLHNQGHLHRDIKAGNILIDSNGSVKLADFGVSASIYEPKQGWTASSSSSARLTDVAGTPYWMAPEVIHSHTGYSFKADIWSFGITALELAHGRPPLSDLPPSKSLLMKITKRFRFSEYEKSHSFDNKKFSKAFKDMVGSCLDQDPSKRPTAEKLLKHPFFRNCKGPDFLVRNLLSGLPSVEERFRASKIIQKVVSTSVVDEEEDSDTELVVHKQRRISGWNFNIDGFELEPVFPSSEEAPREEDSSNPEVETREEQSNEEVGQGGETSNPEVIEESDNDSDDTVVKQVRFGGETIIQYRQLNDDEEEESGNREVDIDIDRERVMAGLMTIRRSLDEQRQQVSDMIMSFGGEATREDQLGQLVERLRLELDNERHRNFELEMELEFLHLQISGLSNAD